MKLFQNFLSLAGAEFIGKLLTFAAFARLARIVGAENFGYIEWAGAVLLCTSLIVDQGFSLYGAREIAKTPLRAKELIGEIVGARFLLTFLAYAVILAFAFCFQNTAFLRNLLLIYGLSLFAAPFLLNWAFQGFDEMKCAASIQLIRQTVFSLIVLVFVQSTEKIWLIAFAEISAVVCAASYGVWKVKRKLQLPVKISFRFSEKLFREGVPIGLSQMFWVIKMFGATLIFGLIATAEDTGYFAGAMRIFIALHTFVWLYYFNLLPSFSRAWSEGGEQFAKLINNSMRLVFLLGAIGGIIWIISAPLMMELIYGRQFAAGGSSLQWLAGACFAAALSGHYRYGLIAAGFQNMELLTAFAGAVVAIVFIPVGYIICGTSGSAAALCFAEIIVLFLAWYLAKRNLFCFSEYRLQINKSQLETLPETAR